MNCESSRCIYISSEDLAPIDVAGRQSPLWHVTSPSCDASPHCVVTMWPMIGVTAWHPRTMAEHRRDPRLWWAPHIEQSFSGDHGTAGYLQLQMQTVKTVVLLWMHESCLAPLTMGKCISGVPFIGHRATVAWHYSKYGRKCLKKWRRENSM